MGCKCSTITSSFPRPHITQDDCDWFKEMQTTQPSFHISQNTVYVLCSLTPEVRSGNARCINLWFAKGVMAEQKVEKHCCIKWYHIFYSVVYCSTINSEEYSFSLLQVKEFRYLGCCLRVRCRMGAVMRDWIYISTLTYGY